VPDSAIDLVLSSVGIGVKAGAPRPAIATVEEVKAALLRARGVAYTRAGASGLYFAKLIQRLGIADQVNVRATIVPEGFSGDAVIRGEAELAIQQVSELMYVPGIEVVGPLPREIESRAVFSIGIMAASPRRAEAAKLMALLTSAEASAVIRRYGLEPLAPR
jgi:molybdate transport system substrate-binding protein